MTLVYTPETRPAEAPTSFEDFLTVLAGLRLSPASTHIDLDHRRLEVYGSSVKLSNKEYELLAYLAQRADEVVSRDELLESVWYGEGLETQTRTIDAHIRRLRAKLPETDLISTLRGQGYRFNSTPTLHACPHTRCLGAAHNPDRSSGARLGASGSLPKSPGGRFQNRDEALQRAGEKPPSARAIP